MCSVWRERLVGGSRARRWLTGDRAVAGCRGRRLYRRTVLIVADTLESMTSHRGVHYQRNEAGRGHVRIHLRSTVRGLPLSALFVCGVGSSLTGHWNQFVTQQGQRVTQSATETRDSNERPIKFYVGPSLGRELGGGGSARAAPSGSNYFYAPKHNRCCSVDGL
jgi:hypothetical protein